MHESFESGIWRSDISVDRKICHLCEPPTFVWALQKAKHLHLPVIWDSLHGDRGGQFSVFTMDPHHGLKRDSACGEQRSTPQCAFCGAHLIAFSKQLWETHLLTYWFLFSPSARKECVPLLFQIPWQQLKPTGRAFLYSKWFERLFFQISLCSKIERFLAPQSYGAPLLTPL